MFISKTIQDQNRSETSSGTQHFTLTNHSTSSQHHLIQQKACLCVFSESNGRRKECNHIGRQIMSQIVG